MKNKASLFITVCLTLCFFSGCKSIEQPKNIEKPLDYTDSDVIENENSMIINNVEYYKGRFSFVKEFLTNRKSYT